MKKSLLLIGAFVLCQNSFAQSNSILPSLFNSNNSTQDKSLFIPVENLAKNNSYDGPLTISDYYVTGGVSSLQYVYDCTYNPSGLLVSMTRSDNGMNPLDRKIYGRNGNGKITSVISQVYTGSYFEFDARLTLEYVQDRLVSQLEESFNTMTNEWEIDELMTVEYVNGYTSPSELIMTSSDGVTIQYLQKVQYQYNASNQPTLLFISEYDTDYNAWIPSQSWNISDWGPTEFIPDFLFANYLVPTMTTTDFIIGKSNQYAIYPAEFSIHSGYDVLTQTFSASQYLHSSVYDAENQRTQFYVDNITATDTLPSFGVTALYDPCYGFQRAMEYQYNAGNYELNYGTEYVGETTPYLNSCYVDAYNKFGSFSLGNPTGTWNRRYEITHFSNLSVDESEMSLFEIYPNPASDFVTIQSTNDGKASVKIIDLMGKVQFQKELISQQNEIKLTDLPNGVYIIEFTSNGSIETSRFIKQ